MTNTTSFDIKVALRTEFPGDRAVEAFASITGRYLDKREDLVRTTRSLIASLGRDVHSLSKGYTANSCGLVQSTGLKIDQLAAELGSLNESLMAAAWGAFGENGPRERYMDMIMDACTFDN